MTQQQERGVECLKKLNIYPPYIEGFKKSKKVCLFEGFGGYWIDKGSEVDKKIREIENRYQCLVYAVTHNITNFGELWGFLIVPDGEEELDEYLVCPQGDGLFITYAYVWNVDDDMCSEFGDILVRSFGGGIHHVG